MAINSVHQFSGVTNTSGAGDEQNFIGVLAPPGKTLTPAEVLQLAVMTALGTSDKAQADEFIKQNNLTPPKEISVFRQNNQVIYQFPADAEFFAAAEDFKQKALPKNNAPLGENNSQREARNFQANQLRSKLTPPVTVPNKLDAAYKNYLQQKNLSDSPTSRQDFLREVRENPKTAAKYHPIFNRSLLV